MATTENNFSGNGTAGPFTYTFPVIEAGDVKVFVNGVSVSNYTVDTTLSTVTFTAPFPTAGQAIRIFRETNIDTLAAEFSAGSAIRASDLNDNFIQNLYVTQEISNNAILTDGSNAFDGDLNMGGNQITNLGTPAVDSDAVTKLYVDSRFSSQSIPGYTRWRTTATASQTVFSGVGESGGTLAYSATRENVYVNGALQQRTVDYTANNGTTITFIVGLQAGDIVDVVCVNNVSTVTSDQSSELYFLQSGTGATTRTVESKLKDVVSVKDFIPAGTNTATTDCTAYIQAANDAALASGASLIFDASATYLVTSVSLSAATILTGGAIFSPSDSASATSPAVSILSTTRFVDSINVQQLNTVRKRCVVLNGSQDLTINSIVITANAQNDFVGNTDNAALRIFACSNVSIGRVSIDKWDYAVKIFGANQNLSIDSVKIRSYINGINLRQGIGVTLGATGGVDVQQLSTTWTTQQPGQNGILIGNDSGVDAGTSYITVINANIKDSGEHGIRVGGGNEVHHVTFESPVVGSTLATGLKILSGDNGIYTRYVTINSPRIYDAVGGGTKQNNGLQIFRVIKCVIDNPVIYKVSQATSCLYGISLYDVTDLTITSPVIQAASSHGIELRLEQADAGGTVIAKDSNQIFISGGTISLCGGDAINIPTQGRQHRRIVVSDTLLQFNTGYGFNINTTGVPTAGEVDYGYFSTIGRANTAGHASVTGTTSKLSFALRGQYTAGLPCANGSTQQDTDSGSFYLRKAGVWTAL